MTIDEEIQQHKWRSELQKGVINTLYTSRFLEERSSRILKPFAISHQQFNILRILRGQGDRPATVKLLTERMLDKSSNASRLIDKLLEKNLVQRLTCPEDRRAVEIRITASGLQLLESIDNQNGDWEDTLPGFPESDALQLSQLLDKLRDAMRQRP